MQTEIRPASAPKAPPEARRFFYQGADITVSRIKDETVQAIGKIPEIRYPSEARKAIVAAANSGTIAGDNAANMVDEIARCYKFGLHAIYRPEEPELEPWFKGICDLAERRAREIPNREALPSCIPRQEIGLHMVGSDKVQARYGSVVKTVPNGSLLPHPKHRKGLNMVESLGILDPFREESIQRLVGNEERMPDLLVQEVMVKEAVDQRGMEESIHDEVRSQILSDCAVIGITFINTRVLMQQTEGVLATSYDSRSVKAAINLRRTARKQDEKTAQYVTQVSWKGNPVFSLAKLPDQKARYEPMTGYPELQEIADQVNALFAGTLNPSKAHRVVEEAWHLTKVARSPKSVYTRAVTRMHEEVTAALKLYRTESQPGIRKGAYAITMQDYGEANTFTINMGTYKWLSQERERTRMSEDEHLMVSNLRARRVKYDTLRKSSQRSEAENEQLLPLLREFDPLQYGRLEQLIKLLNGKKPEDRTFTESDIKLVRTIEERGLVLKKELKQHMGL